jgi:tetratricopeptide (TPR) repeat protein
LEVLSFARSLYDKGEYQLSLLEYRRFLTSFPDNINVFRARIGEADCLFWMGEYDKALKRYLDLAREFSLSQDGWLMALKAARCYQATGQTGVAVEVYKKIADQTRWPGLAEEARFELGWVKLSGAEWKEAAADFEKIPSSSLYGAASRDLAAKAVEGASLPRKDPVTAGVLSGILPGAGQLYCGQPKDAALAVILNGLFIAGAVESFSQELYVLGGILVLIESAWYGGNIYNAVNHAHKYNRKQEQSFIKSLWEESQVNLVLPDKDRDWFQLMLNFRF